MIGTGRDATPALARRHEVTAGSGAKGTLAWTVADVELISALASARKIVRRWKSAERPAEARQPQHIWGLYTCLPTADFLLRCGRKRH